MAFSLKLLSWYQTNKRDLPWRRTKDPYLIWLSEVIMQQTRIAQGLPYFEKFVLSWPTVSKLAEADEREVLKVWQGLGYYSRARNMHETARAIMKLHGGKFPGTYAGLMGLKGIGEYTAAAIASIAFGIPCPVADGNVIRFMARLHGIEEPAGLVKTKRKILAIALQNIDHRQPGDFNQAMMEFGATVCTPVNPGCSSCLFQTGCAALATGRVGTIPVRAPKARLRQRFVHYIVVTVEDENHVYIYLNKRLGDDIWKNLYDFPQMDGTVGEEDGQAVNEIGSLKVFQPDMPNFLGVSKQYLHVLTHQELHVRFYRFHYSGKAGLPFVGGPVVEVPIDELSKYPIPRLIERYLSENFQPLHAGFSQRDNIEGKGFLTVL